MNRTTQDFKNWSSHINNKEYYQYHPSNKDMFRTIYVRNNFLSGRPTANFSNWITGTPPDGIPHIHPLHLQKLMTMQSGGDFF